ncbi:MAG: thioredoxin domain-containing protein [Pirellulales bacterium]
MNKRLIFSVLVLVIAAGFPEKSTQAEIPWLPSIEQAKQTAAVSNRLVLVHFWSTSCPPCMKLERRVYNEPGIAEEITAGYVPVKIDTRRQPAIARQYGVRTIPADIVMAPDGTVIAKRTSPLTRTEYTAGLTQLESSYRRQSNSDYSNVSPDATPAGYGVHAPAAAAPTVETQYTVPPVGGRPQQSSSPSGSLAPQIQPPPTAGETAVSTTAGPSSQIPAPQPPTNSLPPLALDGFCSVTLVETEQWRPGDPRWGAIHRDQLYLFSGPEQQQQFLQNPDEYSPALAGNDAVIALEQNRLTAGNRKHGLFCGKSVYLFSSEETLQRFQADWTRYVQGIRQAEVTGQLLR